MQWSLCCHINVRIAYTICGILIGLFWACVYIFAWKNWVALGTCLFATSFAFETFWFYLSIKRDKILKWRPITFQILFWINLFVGFLSIGGMIAAIVLAATKHQGISNQQQHGLNWWSTATWFLVMLKWTWQNAFIARLFSKKLKKSIIQPEEPEDPSTWKY
ncbi:Protein CBG05990 [Caenorhabditis briggsae]|uniref:Uncharacterized protein n=2 Tax=Caenorhabditis briggsae TaxID=6238 RepID=A0AAE9ABB6_CAEBR|nr:Protein CBG05990 [Caenorhabditis briggsae]ULT95278.1 hypothetical protein L3Y34_004183 [Caenorhabditis briggsae]UMM28482.1 hypothetical protein L5515_011304 [Caenorhabditis briggsae]CAP26371.2 Protein CBG05990 [Caenorhabditis briggsae]